jgi:thiol peroxidase
MAEERKGAATFKGAPLTLVGPELRVGDEAPDFTALKSNLEEFYFKSTAGKARLISVVPSLDTPVCEQQTRRFNAEAAKLGAKVAVLAISMDLPFAQSRFCATAGIANLTTLSDHRAASFGQRYGVLIKELRLLARAVFVVGADGRVTHAQCVKEVTAHPDYDAALAAARAAAEHA